MTFDLIRNTLLTSLPEDVLSRLLPSLRLCPLTIRHTLINPQAGIDAVWFVESGRVSLIATLADGRQAEVGSVGREGMVGLPLIGGVGLASTEALVQTAGTALRMEAGAFRRAMANEKALRPLLCRYQEAVHSQLALSVACLGHHNLEQRLAGWLLGARDCLQSDVVPVTQEFLSQMLCVRRSSVSGAAQVLERRGMIEYARGNITLLDHSALEAVACDCHLGMRLCFERLQLAA